MNADQAAKFVASAAGMVGNGTGTAKTTGTGIGGGSGTAKLTGAKFVA